MSVHTSTVVLADTATSCLQTSRVSDDKTDVKYKCRQGIRTEARYIRSNAADVTEGTGVLENLILIATFGAPDQMASSMLVLACSCHESGLATHCVKMSQACG